MKLPMFWMPPQIYRTSDQAVIPEDDGNSDYQAYLIWAQTYVAGVYKYGDTYDPNDDVKITPEPAPEPEPTT
jgi:hypothetical protein